MGTEVDSLEVKVEASAKSANAELDKLIAKMKEVQKGLASITGKDFGLKSTREVEKDLDSIFNKAESIGKKKIQIDIDDKKVKKAAKSYNELLEKYRNSKLMVDFKVDKLGVEELEKMQDRISKKFRETMQGINDTMERKGTDSILGDAWERRIQKAQQYKNLLNEIRGARGLSPVILDGTETKQAFSRIVSDRDRGIATEQSMGRLHSILSKIKKTTKTIYSTFSKIHKKIEGVTSKAKALKDALTGANKAGGKMTMAKMLGMSLVFSSVFSALSAITKAIKEGSNNLVQYSSDYNKSISGIVTSLLYLKNAWAAAFAPIVNAVAPYISTFIDMLAGAMNMVGQFTAALTGKGTVVQAKKAWKDYAASLDTTKNSAKDASDALKDLMNYTLGIDELNVIQPSSSSSSGSGSSGSTTSPSPSDMFETIEVSDSMNKLAEMFKEALKNSDFTDIGRMLSNKLSSAMEGIEWQKIYHKADNFGKDLATFLNGLITPRLFYDVGNTIAGSLNTALHSINSFEISLDWKNLGNSLASGLKGFFENWDAGLTASTFSNFVTGIIEGVTGFLDGMQSNKLFENIGQDLVDLICGIDWGKITWDLIGFARSFEKAIVNLPNDLLRGAMQKLADKLTGGEVEIKLPKFVLPPLSGLGLFAYGQDIITDILKGISGEETKIPESFGRIKNSIFKKFDDIGSWFGKKFGSARKTIESKFSDIGPWFSNRKTDIQNGMKDIEPWMLKKYTSARKDVNSAFQNVGSWFGQRKTDIQNNMSNINTWFATKYQNARSKVNSSFQNVGTWFGNRRNDIQNNMQNISTWFSNKFKSSRSFANAPFSNIGSWFGQKREDIKSNMRSISQWFKDIFKSAYNGITSIFDKVGGYFDKVAGWIKSPVLGAVKAIAKAVNWVYEKLGGDGDLINVSDLNNYANGTNGVARDSFGVVNDQSGNTYRELVQYPNGQTVIPTGRNVVLPMPKGTKVMPANQTAALMGITGVKKYKSGIGNFFGSTADKISDIASNIFGYIKDPKKLLKAAIDKFTDLTGALEPGITLAKSAVNSVFDTAVSKIKGFFDSFGTVSYKPSAGVEQWRGLAKQALMMTHQFSEANLNALLTQMMHESGGNPNAINNWDINAIRGIPSKGLMQVIDPTFHANAEKGYNTDIYDPLSNMMAAINYTVKRYGSLYAGWTARGYKGYANGIGTFKLSDVVGKYSVGGFPQNGELFVANEKAPEYVGRMGNRNVVANNNQIVTGVSNGVAEANRTTERLLQKLIEQNERLLRKNTSLMMNSKKVNKELSRGSRNSGYSFSTT